MSLFFLSCAIVFTALAQTSFKLYHQKSAVIYVVIAIILFSITPLMTYLALRELSLSFVYMSTGFTYVLIMLLAKFVLNEVIEKQHIHAVILIISGVLVFNL